MRYLALALTALVLALALGAVWWDDSPSAPAPPSAAQASTPPADDGLRTVAYRIDGTAELASITAVTPTGIQQAADARVPASQTYEMPVGEFVSVSAQNTGPMGVVACSILVDGRIVSANESIGGGAIASCDATVE